MVKRKALIIVENNSVPFDTRVWNEARTLHESEYDVTVLCPRSKGYEQGYELIDGIHIYRHPIPKERNSLLGYLSEYGSALIWELLYTLWIYLRRGFHVIHGCNPPDNIFLIALPFKLFGIKYIFDQHDANPELYLSKYGEKGILYTAQLWLEKLTYQCSDVVIATNSSYRDLAVNRGGLDPMNVFIVRNGPDLTTFKSVPPNSALKHGKRYLVGYVGTMSVQEGMDILLDVAQHIKHLGRRDIHFSCIGGGPALPLLRKMVRDKELADMVNFTGRIPYGQLIEILSTADVCVNPDRPCQMNDISTMIKIMEYMALEKPIVQFDLKEGRFSAQEASLYADNRDLAKDFAAKILWLIDNPEERKRMGEFGRRRVEKELAWEYSTEHLLAAYQRAFGKGQSDDPVANQAKQNSLRVSREKTAISNTSVWATLVRKRAQNPSSGIGSCQRQPNAKIEPEMNRVFLEHFRCPAEYGDFILTDKLSEDSGFFRFGKSALCYGQSSAGFRANKVTDTLYDVFQDVTTDRGIVCLPFDPAQVADNFRNERYRAVLSEETRKFSDHPLVRRTYYFFRPLLSVSVRRHLQRMHLNRERHFPAWPVDRTVECIAESLLALSLRSHGLDKIPFIWFWPHGFESCVIMTHDVETKSGRDFCSQLMDMDDSFGIKSSFQIVPERRYSVSEAFLESIRRRGCEINIQDLNHDGQLFTNRKRFLLRAERINQYGQNYGATGFRSAVLYRNPNWYDALDFSYDMSIPNSAYLEPQQGGCCTVMPYFIGSILELPVTTTQDYSLFHILGVYSIDLWKSQIASITEKHGLISFIVHPDYIRAAKPALDAYIALLEHLSTLRSNDRIWAALPREVDHWWRQRSQMRLVFDGGKWSIRGEGSERARLAYASLAGDSVRYAVDGVVGG